MELLNLSSDGGYSPKRSNKFRAVIGVGVIAAAVGLSSTLAANISINAGPVEFGQGDASTFTSYPDVSGGDTSFTSSFEDFFLDYILPSWSA